MLKTERFFLREFEAADWEAVHVYASQEVVSQYQPWGPNTKDETQRYIKEILKQQLEQPRTHFTSAVVWEKTGTVIGAAELTSIDAVNRSGEIGYILHPDYWRKGIAGEVAAWLLRFGFEKQQLHRIWASCDPQNIGSQKVLKKIGMVREGVLRQNLRMNEGWRDSLIYSVLEEEWKNGGV